MPVDVPGTPGSAARWRRPARSTLDAAQPSLAVNVRITVARARSARRRGRAERAAAVDQRRTRPGRQRCCCLFALQSKQPRQPTTQGQNQKATTHTIATKRDGAPKASRQHVQGANGCCWVPHSRSHAPTRHPLRPECKPAAAPPQPLAGCKTGRPGSPSRCRSRQCKLGTEQQPCRTTSRRSPSAALRSSRGRPRRLLLPQRTRAAPPRPPRAGCTSARSGSPHLRHSRPCTQGTAQQPCRTSPHRAPTPPPSRLAQPGQCLPSRH